MKRPLSVLVVVAIATILAAPVSAEKRVALVIGNGAYRSVQKLSNPPNDAADMAAKLEGLGFSVTKLVDADLAAMEKARVDFAREATGAAIRVFYYAGHGVQSDGTNWLLPVEAAIREDYELKLKAFSAQAVLDGLKAAGPGVNLVVLDACRDNPFKTTSRSAGSSRGLAVMGTSGSLIVYATGPGSTAADGSGRNGVFTAALLARLDSPGMSLQEIMTNVAADVVAATKGAQEPWKQDNLTKMVYIVTPEEARARFAERIAREEAAAAAEQARLATLQAQAARESDAAKKAAMEVEIKKQAALQKQKADELAMLKAEKERQEAAEKAQADMAAQLAKFQGEAQAREASIREAAGARRRQLATIQGGGSAGGIGSIVAAVDASRAALVDLDAQYAASLKTVRAAVAGTYDARLAALSKWTMDPWENQKEFEARVAAERNRLSAEKSSALSAAQEDSDGQRQAAVQPFIEARDAAIASVARARTAYKGESVAVSVGAFDRDAKTFPVTVTSKVAGMPFTATFNHSVAGATTDELKANYLRFEAWQKASAFFGELDISYAAAGTASEPAYVVVLDAWRVKAVDTAGESVLHEEKPARPLVYFTGSADLDKPRVLSSSLSVTASGARIRINGTDAGTDRAFVVDPRPGTYTIQATTSGGTVLTERKTVAKGGHELITMRIPGSLSVSTDSGDGIAEVWLNGKNAGTTPFKAEMPIGTIRVEVRWSDPYTCVWSETATLVAGTVTQLTAVKKSLFTVGDKGPAGGLVFYDKGYSSDGWRYLEAAPGNQSTGIQWWNGKYVDIPAARATGIGSGKANTEAIVAAQGKGSYAAQLCSDLVLGGYDDWFLPSKDELDLMYKNLKEAGLGGFGGVWFWSSSQDDTSLGAWKQNFSDGGQGYNYKGSKDAVRAVRAF